MPAVETSIVVDKRSLARLVRALNDEADGRELKRDLLARFELAAVPAVASAQAAIMSMPSRGYAHESLRASVAGGVEPRLALGGPKAGVDIIAHRVRTRGFWYAPKRLNRNAGWLHPVYGSPTSTSAASRRRYADRSTWVHQEGLPGWFDTTLRLQKPAFQKAAKAAMDAMAARIDRKTR